MATPFRDFIPEGEPVDALGKGLVDFVPTPKPVATPTATTPLVETAEAKVPAKPNKKKTK